MNNILCFPKKYNCPLNDIQISFNNNLTLLNKGYKEVLLKDNNSIYLNNEINIDRPIIVSIFLSIDKPWDHEWDNLMVNKKKDKKRTYYPFESYDIYMINSTTFNISLKDILIWEENNEKLKTLKENVNASEYYYLFHKNYIGFKNYRQFKKFEELFNINDYKNNPLFKLSKTLKPYITSIVFGFILIIFFLILIVISCVDGIGEKCDKICFAIFIGLAHLIILINFIVYVYLYFTDRAKFKKMDFEFDEQIQIVFNLYSKRIKHPIYDKAIIIIFITMLPYYVYITILLVYIIVYLILEIIEKCDFCGIC